VLHFGDHNMNCGVRSYQGPEAYQGVVREISEAFGRADFPQVIRLMDRHFGESSYSLKSLFRDEQRKILDQILASTREDVENRFRQITDSYTPLMRFLEDLGAPLPSALHAASDYVLNTDLRRQFETDEPGIDRIRMLLDEVFRRKVELYSGSLGYAIKNHLEHRIVRLAAEPDNQTLLSRTTEIAGTVQAMPFDVNLWRCQNGYFEMLKAVRPDYQQKASKGDAAATEWLRHFDALGDQLGFSGVNR